MTKHEIYEALKADGAKLPKAERFMGVDDLKEIYTERFGVSPDEASTTPESTPDTCVEQVDEQVDEQVGEQVDETQELPPDEAPNTHLLREEDEPAPAYEVEEIHLLRFAESGWCPELNRSYRRGLYRPASLVEYKAL